MIDHIEVTDLPETWARLDSHSGALAFDVGANCGQAMRHLAPRFDRVVCFEPNPDSFAVLDACKPANVTAEQRAVSDQTGSVELAVAARSIQSGQYVSAGPGLNIWGTIERSVTVPCSTIDDLVAEFGVPELIKVDTEGHEIQVLRGGVASISEHRPYLHIEVHHRVFEQEIRAMFPTIEFDKVEHEGLPEGHHLRVDNFYLLGGGL